jgi:hypothetical protein
MRYHISLIALWGPSPSSILVFQSTFEKLKREEFQLIVDKLIKRVAS